MHGFNETGHKRAATGFHTLAFHPPAPGGRQANLSKVVAAYILELIQAL
jgi:hypothetical protein